MKRLLAIAMLSVFVTSASASSEKCKECETTWLQWFGNTAVFVMAEQYAATKIPLLDSFNMFVVDKGMTAASLASTWAMARFAKKATAPVVESTKDD